jgi:hypothetical protein
MYMRTDYALVMYCILALVDISLAVTHFAAGLVGDQLNDIVRQSNARFAAATHKILIAQS